MAFAFLLFSIAFMVFALYITRKKPHQEIVGDHVVIIGSGIGGMIHAKILSIRFKKVTVIEKDEIPANAEYRRGTPQGTQFHSLMTKGFNTFNRLFPNLEARYAQHGVKPVEPFKNLIYYIHHGPIGPFYDGFGSKMYPCTRPLLEHILRQELIATTPNLELIGNSTVTDLVFDSQSNSVKGVCISQGGEESEILADLVVDCSGANTKQNSLAFLKQRGLEITTDEVDAGIGYTSALYTFNGKDPTVTHNGKKEPLSLFMNQPKPSKGTFKGFGMGPVEDDKWHCLWFGYAKHYPPSTEEELMNWSTEVPSYHFMKEIFAQGTRVSDFKSYRGAKCRRIRLDKVEKFPDGLVISGDALASFTPIYAQGMSFSCMCAEALDDTLAVSQPYDLKGVAKRFIKNAQTPIELCWNGAAAQDFTVPGVQTNTQPPAGFQFMNGYIDYVFKVSAEEQHKEVFSRFLKVVTMVAHPLTLFAPPVMIPVARKYLQDTLRNSGIFTKSV